MTEVELSENILKVSKLIRDNISDFKKFENNEVKKMTSTHIKTSTKIKAYDKGITNSEQTFAYIIKNKYIFFGIDEYIRRHKGKYTLLKELMKDVKEKFELSETDLQNFFRLYIEKIAFEETPVLPSDEELAELSSIFLSDLKKNPPDWKIKLWIEGLWLNEETISMSKDFKIRKPIDSDLVFIEDPTFSLNPPIRFEQPSAILEINFFQIPKAKINKQITNLITALRLFKVGSINIIKREYKPMSIRHDYGMPGEMKTYAPYKYQITEGEAQNLNSFLENILPLLPDYGWDKIENERNSTYIAIDRYTDALTKHQSIENKITNVITSLEALLLKAQERTELNHKLSQRVSFLTTLLERPNLEALSIYSNVKRAYNIRSIFIHGSMLKQREKKDLNSILEVILELNRICILVSIDIRGKYKKDDFISTIDNSLLDHTTKENLSEELKNLKLINLA